MLKQRKLLFVIGVAAVLAIVAALTTYFLSNAASLPNPSHVDSMSASLFGQKDAKGKSVTFTVPSAQIPTILAALSPSTRDWLPSQWIVIGALTITCKDGTQMKVDLYQTRHDIGAFSVHPGDRPRNSSFVSNYFRGGTDKAIEDAIADAYQSSKDE